MKHLEKPLVQKRTREKARMMRHEQQLSLLQQCFRRQLRRRTNGAAARSPPHDGSPPPTLLRLHRPHRWFTSTPTCTSSASPSPFSSFQSDMLLLSFKSRNRNDQNVHTRFHPTLHHRLPHPHHHYQHYQHPPCVSSVTSSRSLMTWKRWMSSFSSPPSSGFDPSGRSDPVSEPQQEQPPTPTLSPNSPIYDPRTNEPAGLRRVLDGMKRVEQQITNMEHDIMGIKQIVKKIRESNGITENRMDSVEQLADTMQADLHTSMGLVRALTKALKTKRENTGRHTYDDDNTTGRSNLTTGRDTIQFHHQPTIPTNTANDPQSRASATAAALREKFRRDYAQRQQQLSDHQPIGPDLSPSQNYDNNPFFRK